MGKLIAIANMKGGVGKTATVVALAEGLAASGHSVLVIDMDAQASASICVAGDGSLAELIREGKTIDAFLDDHLLTGAPVTLSDYVRRDASDVVHRGEPLPIALLAASPALRVLEREIIFDLTKQDFGLNAVVGQLFRIMREHLGREKRRFDYILLDCAPGISALTEVSIRVADLVIVPTIPDFLSTYGLQAFCASLWKGPIAKSSELSAPRNPPKVLVTRRRKTVEQDKTAAVMRNESKADRPSFELYKIEVPEAAAIAAALAKTGTSPTFHNKWGSPVVDVIDHLVSETKEALHGP